MTAVDARVQFPPQSGEAPPRARRLSINNARTSNTGAD